MWQMLQQLVIQLREICRQSCRRLHWRPRSLSCRIGLQLLQMLIVLWSVRSLVSLSVCLFVGHTGEPCNTDRPIEMPFRDLGNKPRISWGRRIAAWNEHFLRKHMSTHNCLLKSTRRFDVARGRLCGGDETGCCYHYSSKLLSFVTCDFVSSSAYSCNPHLVLVAVLD